MYERRPFVGRNIAIDFPTQWSFPHFARLALSYMCPRLCMGPGAN